MLVSVIMPTVPGREEIYARCRRAYRSRQGEPCARGQGVLPLTGPVVEADPEGVGGQVPRRFAGAGARAED